MRFGKAREVVISVPLNQQETDRGSNANSLFHLAFCNYHILTEALNHKPYHNIALLWKNFDRFGIKTLSLSNPQPLHYHTLFDKAGLLFGNLVLHLDLFGIKFLSLSNP